MAAPGEEPPSSAQKPNARAKASTGPAPALEPATTGAMLAAAREAAGVELADIAKTTRVPLRHLRALEADDHDALPALPYTQGFVRAFAIAVGLDPNALVARFRSETSKQPHVPTPMAMSALDERRLPASGLVIASLLGLVAVIALLSAWGSGAFDPDLPNPDLAQAPASPPSAPFIEAAPPPATEAADASNTVVLTAREEVWVRLYDPETRTVAKTGIMSPGERFTVPEDTPGLRLWTGRAGALVVTLGARELPPLGGAAEVLRDVSLAPADLQSRTSSLTPEQTTTPQTTTQTTEQAPVPDPVTE